MISTGYSADGKRKRRTVYGWTKKGSRQDKLAKLQSNKFDGNSFALQSIDVDLKAGAVAVRHTMSELNGKLELTEPKNTKSRRRIELPIWPFPPCSPTCDRSM